MHARTHRLHFTSLEAYSGFASIEGIVRTAPDHLALDYQIKDSLVGVVKSSKKELIIPYEELEELEYKRNWFVSRLKLTVFNLELLEQFPAAKNGQIVLKIKRNKKEMAKDLESYVKLRMSEIKLDRM